MINKIAKLPNNFENLLIEEFILNPYKFIVLKKEIDEIKI